MRTHLHGGRTGRRDGLTPGISWPCSLLCLFDVTGSNCSDIYREMWSCSKLLCLVFTTQQCVFTSSAHAVCLQHSSNPYSVIYGREMCRAPRLLCSDDDNCSLSITYKRHIYPQRDAFDTPVFITSHRLARMQRVLAEQHQPDLRGGKRQGICLIWTCCVRWEERSQARRKPNRKLWSRGPAKLSEWT